MGSKTAKDIIAGMQIAKPESKDVVVRREHEMLPVLNAENYDKLTTGEKHGVRIMTPSDKNRIIGELTEDDLGKLSDWIIEKAVFTLQLTKIKTNDISHEGMMTNQELSRAVSRFRTLTVEEVKHVVEISLGGRYLADDDSFVHFSPANVSIWLKRYSEETRRSIRSRVTWLYERQLAQVVETVDDARQKETLIGLVNYDVVERIKNPLYRRVGCSMIADELDRFEINKYNKSSAVDAYNAIKRLKPKLDVSRLEDETKTELYNRFVGRLAKEWEILDENGKPKLIE